MTEVLVRTTKTTKAITILAATAALMAVPPLVSAAPAFAAPQQSAQSHRTLHPGDRGSDVKALQARLTALHYDPGTVDGIYGKNTVPAVWAFQKVNHIKPSSTVGAATWRALDHPRTPTPLIRRGARSRVEVDLKHQLLYIYRNNALILISHISSGSGKLFTVNGHTERAVTPAGNFVVQRRIKGWHQSQLGWLYNPLYFSGGYAIHGETEVPLYPASHGCVRIPLHTADMVPTLVPNGEAVYVRR